MSQRGGMLRCVGKHLEECGGYGLVPKRVVFGIDPL